MRLPRRIVLPPPELSAPCSAYLSLCGDLIAAGRLAAAIKALHDLVQVLSSPLISVTPPAHTAPH